MIDHDGTLISFAARHDRGERLVWLRLMYSGANKWLEIAMTPDQANSLAAGLAWAEPMEKLMEKKKYVCPNEHVTEREALISNTYCAPCFMEWAQKKFPVQVVPPEEPASGLVADGTLAEAYAAALAKLKESYPNIEKRLATLSGTFKPPEPKAMRPAFPLVEYANYRRVHVALHALWTKHAHEPGYDKALWMELDKAIGLLATDGPGEHERSLKP